MRLLLDECVPKRLKWELRGHEAETVQDIGWAGIKNGVVLRLANGPGMTKVLQAEGATDELM